MTPPPTSTDWETEFMSAHQGLSDPKASAVHWDHALYPRDTDPRPHWHLEYR